MPALLLALKLLQCSKFTNCKRQTTEMTFHQSDPFLRNRPWESTAGLSEETIPELYPSWAMVWHFLFAAGKDWSQTTVLFNWREKNKSCQVHKRLPLPSPPHKHTLILYTQKKTVSHIFPNNTRIIKRTLNKCMGYSILVQNIIFCMV